MNAVSFGAFGGLGDFPLLAAAVVLALGLWTGQRRLGFQGMWWVLGATLLGGALSMLLLPAVARSVLAGGGAGGANFWLRPAALLSLALSQALAFLPLLVAALQVSRLRAGQRGQVR